MKEHAKLPKEEQWRMQSEGKWVGLGNYEDIREDAFVVLSLLPSAETVAVLGHFLEDSEGRDGKNFLGNAIVSVGDVTLAAPNCGKAYIALSRLGIEHPPTRAANAHVGDVDYDFDRVDAWKGWWNEVKTGKRTYRFAGSPVEYGPDGSAASDKLARIALDRKRDLERGTRHQRATGEKGSFAETASAVVSKPGSFAIILASLLALASATWLFFKRKPM